MNKYVDDLIVETEKLDEPEKKEWTITSPSVADWAIETIKERERLFNDYEKVAKERISMLENQIQTEREKMETDTAFLRYKLDEYLDDLTAPTRETKTMRIMELPSGKVERRLERLDFVRDNDELIETLAGTEFVTLEPKLDWRGIKSQLRIATTYLFTDTGEVKTLVEPPTDENVEVVGYEAIDPEGIPVRGITIEKVNAVTTIK